MLVPRRVNEVVSISPLAATAYGGSGSARQGNAQGAATAGATAARIVYFRMQGSTQSRLEGSGVPRFGRFDLAALLPSALALASLAFLWTAGHDWLEHPGDQPARTIALFLWLFGVILWCAVGVMRHADVLAHRLGEPFGALILTLSAISIEVSIIAVIMLVGEQNPELARDTMFAILMIILGDLVGAALLAGGLATASRATTWRARGSSSSSSCRWPPSR